MKESGERRCSIRILLAAAASHRTPSMATEMEKSGAAAMARRIRLRAEDEKPDPANRNARDFFILSKSKNEKGERTKESGG